MEGENNFPMECARAVNRKIINCLIKTGNGNSDNPYFRIQLCINILW